MAKPSLCVTLGLSSLVAACAVDGAPDDVLDDEPVASLTSALVPASPAGARPLTGDFDGDGVTDFSLKADNGHWYIDLGGNGLGGRWDRVHWGYGNASAVPCPADYDGDGKTDLAIKDSTGFWGVDYAANGFGAWDQLNYARGGTEAVPVPADYDRDGKADLAVKTTGGWWLIDRSSNGFGAWDIQVGGYGDATAIPVPGDYDGDGYADLAVKNAQGYWHIDYWRLGGFGSWNLIRGGWGDATSVPVPYDYDRDGKTDLAVKNAAGNWIIDYTWDGYGRNLTTYGGRGGSWSIALPGDFDGDGRTDITVKDTSGWWLVDWAGLGGIGAWDLYVDNPGRVLRDTSRPYIDSYSIRHTSGSVVSPSSPGEYPLAIGERYVVEVLVKPGSTPNWKAGVEINPELSVPEALKIANRIGSTDSVPINSSHYRRFALVCTEPGNFPLGYMMRLQHITAPGQAFNQDYGIRVRCSSPKLGLHGRVLNRRSNNGVFFPDTSRPVGGARVTVGALTTTADSQGYWHLPGVTGGPHKIIVTEDYAHSPTVVLNVRVPTGSGIQVDTVMEERFGTLRERGIDYTMYVDYSRPRTHLHVVRIDPARSTVKAEPAPVEGWANGKPLYRKLLSLAADESPDALVMINGGYFKTDNTVRADGYYYSRGYLPSAVSLDGGGYPAEGTTTLLEPLGSASLFTIIGTGHDQQFGMLHAETDFLSRPSLYWARDGAGNPILDGAPRDGMSDADYVMQVGPRLLETAGATKLIPWRGDITWPWFVQQWPRTTVGFAPGAFFIVVADGENINGGQGASFHHLGEFYRDELGATQAINLDGGHSTEIILMGQYGPRRINTMTGEDSSWSKDPFSEYVQAGGVHNYIMVSP